MRGHAARRSFLIREALCLSWAVLSCALLSAPAWSALELSPLPPAARGCSNPEALGLAAGSASFIYHDLRASGPAGITGAYGYRPFGLGGIDVLALCGKVTMRRRGVGVGFSYTGLSGPGYAEQVVSVCAAVSRGDLWLQPGMRFAQVTAPDIYSGRCIAFDFLAYVYVIPSLRVSFSAANAFGSGLGAAGGQVPRRVGAGLGYAVSDRVACGLRIEKENGQTTALSTGIEWRAMRGFFVRLGSCTFPREFSAGLGLRVGALGLDMASTVNFDLGITHEAGISYLWK